MGKSVAKEGAKKALEVGKSAAVDVGKKLVSKALRPKSKKILQKYTEPETRDINALIDGSAIAIQDLVKKLNSREGIKTELVQKRVTDFGNWLTGRVGPEQTSQVLNEIVEHVRMNYPPRQSFEVGESNSTLREFTRVYTINGKEGYGARRFLQDARQNLTSVLRNNRKTKVKLILKYNMERQTNSKRLYIQPLFITTFRSI